MNLPFMSKKYLPLNRDSVFICAGEPSGDFHASNLVSEILKKMPCIKIHGMGGQLMKNAGVDIVFDCHEMAVMGITDVAAKSLTIIDAYNTVAAFLSDKRPGLLILVDYPGFNLKIARKASALGIPVFYYISPKVWAWGSGRLEKLRRYVSHMALILPFEEDFYRAAGIRATFVGNPLIDSIPVLVKPENVSDFIKNPVIGLLPGSRSGEISRHLPVMLEAAEKIYAKIPGARFILSLKEADLAKKILDRFSVSNVIEIETGGVSDIFRKSDVLVAASGTVTLEAAVAGLPTVIIYIMSDLSFRIAKNLVRVKYAGLANLIAGREIMPEFLQNEASPEKIADKITYMLEHPEIIKKIKADFRLVRKRLGKPGAAGRAADLALALLSENLK